MGIIHSIGLCSGAGTSGDAGSPEATRLAPSPTGALHLGNARTFLVNWAMARRRGWRIVLRIEDLDGPRVKPGAIEGTIRTLAWLGLDWDAGPIVQSEDLRPYRDAMTELAAAGLVYPCELTRAQIESAASAPQEGAHETPFPAGLRPSDIRPRRFDVEETNWRLVVPPGAVEFADDFAGPQRHDPAESVGDFIVWTRRGQPSYQLAVVVDDHRQGVTRIVRGDDLLDSAARQLRLYGMLGYPRPPSYTHLPLVKGPDGRRLAKRHGDTRVESYRSRGVPAERVVGLMAAWCGLVPRENPTAMSAAEFRDRLDLRTMTREPIVCTAEDDRWLNFETT